MSVAIFEGDLITDAEAISIQFAPALRGDLHILAVDIDQIELDIPALTVADF